MNDLYNLSKINSDQINAKFNCYLIIYDVTCNKMRNKLSKLLEGYGVRVQKSCFELRIESKVLEDLLKELEKNFTDDGSIICYKIYANEIVRYHSRFVADEDPVLIFI